MKTIQRLAALTATTLAVAIGQPAQAQSPVSVGAVIEEILKQNIREHCYEEMSTTAGYTACVILLFDEYELSYTRADIRWP